MVKMAGHGVRIREAGAGLWDLEVWVAAERWSDRGLARIRDACERLSRPFSDPAPPSLQWDTQDLAGRIPKGEKRFFRPFLATDRLWVAPPGAKVPLAPGQALLELEAGKPRTTGIHPATRGCLRLLQDLTSEPVPEAALDVGTGSSILALDAARMGVGRVLALDVDPHAVEIARGNVRRNGFRGVIKVRCQDVAREGGRYPLVMANLSHKLAAKRADALLRCVAPGGWLILGGIWWRWADRTLEKLAPPLRVVRQEREAWWVAFLLRRD